MSGGGKEGGTRVREGGTRRERAGPRMAWGGARGRRPQAGNRALEEVWAGGLTRDPESPR